MLRFAHFCWTLAASTALLSVTIRDAHAIGQATGRVTGTITEPQTQAPVPGASVSISGGAGVHKEAQTGDDGTFEIRDVPPGTYDLDVSYPGMKSIRRRVTVRPDAATPMMIEWSAEAAEEETTVVEEERRLTNPDSPQTGEIYSVDRVNQLPLARQYQSIPQQVPGVTVAGGNPNVKGATVRNNRYLVNGLDLTDPVTNTFSANFQQDSLDTVNVTTGGFEAKYNALGSIISVQTRRGTNEFHGATSAYWAPSGLVDYGTFGPASYNGRKGWDYSSVRPEQGRYELNLTAQGPIVKDKLFFNTGIQYLRSNAVQPAGPPRFVQSPSRLFEAIYLLGGITYVPARDHRIHVEAFGDPTTIDYENNDGGGTSGTPGANNATPLSQRGRSQGGWRFTTEWAWQASKNVATKIMAGFNENRLDVMPQGVRGIAAEDWAGVKYAWGRAGHLNRDDSTWWFNDPDGRYKTTRRRYQVDASVTITGQLAGRHEIEYGLQSSWVEHRSQQMNTGGPETRDGWGLAYSSSGGGPLDTGLCDMDPSVNPAVAQGSYTGNGCYQRTFSRNFVAHQSGNTLGVYLQDRWKPVRWLTILPGIRWDVGTVRVTDSSVAITGRGFGPRLSVIGDVTGDQKTIAQVSYGRMTEMPYLLGVSAYDSTRRSYSVVERYDSNSRAFRFYQAAGGADSVRFNFDRRAATMDEILLSLRRELAEGMLVRVDYTYRYFQNMFVPQEVNAIMDPTGTRTAGWVNGKPIRVTEYGYNALAYNKYSGVDLILEARAKSFEFQGGYTLSWSWGPGIDANVSNTAFENPRFQQFYYSYQPGIDTRHHIKTSTTYRIQGFTVGMIVNWRSGIALRRNYPSAETDYTVQRAPVGNEPGTYYNTGTSNPGQLGTHSDVRSWAEYRTPDLLTCNLMLSYDLAELIKQHVIVNMQINNVLGLSTPTALNQTEGAPNSNQFGLAVSRQQFRSFMLGARYQF